jgi:single-stranded DNA-binding protein
MTKNFVTLTGRIAFEPKVFETKNGGKIASITMNSYIGKDKDGKAQYMGIGVKTFDAKAAEALVNLGKGADIIVVGRLNAESYEKDGKAVNIINVIADYVGVEA